MIEGKLTSKEKESEEFEFVGEASVLIYGTGKVQILKSVDGSAFFPLTDAAGNPAVFEGDATGGVILNSEITNKSRRSMFKIVAETPLEVNYIVEWGW